MFSEVRSFSLFLCECTCECASVVNAKCALKMEFFHGGKIPSKNDTIKIPHIGVTVVRRDLIER